MRQLERRDADVRQWEATVLEHTYDHVDYISLHAYFEHLDGDRPGCLGAGHAMDRFIDGVVATCDHVGAKKRSRRKLQALLRRVEPLARGPIRRCRPTSMGARRRG